MLYYIILYYIILYYIILYYIILYYIILYRPNSLSHRTSGGQTDGKQTNKRQGISYNLSTEDLKNTVQWEDVLVFRYSKCRPSAGHEVPEGE